MRNAIIDCELEFSAVQHEFVKDSARIDFLNNDFSDYSLALKYSEIFKEYQKLKQAFPFMDNVPEQIKIQMIDDLIDRHTPKFDNLPFK